MELKKLVLSKETVKVLSDEALSKVGGGVATYPCIDPGSESCGGTCGCGSGSGGPSAPCYWP